MSKRFFASILAVLLTVSLLAGCGGSRGNELLDSGARVTLDSSYTVFETTYGGSDVASFTSSDFVSFDVYDRGEGDGTRAAFYAFEDATAEGTTVVTAEVNGLSVARYYTYDGDEIDQAVYVIDTGSRLVELDFWIEDEDDVRQAEMIVSTLEKKRFLFF